MPRMAGVFGHDASPLARFIFRRLWSHSRRLFKNPPHSRWAEMNAGPSQRLGDLFLAECRAEQFDPLDRVANQIGKAIHRHVCPKQRIVIGAPKPCPDRGIRDKKPTSRFGLGPAAHRAEFKNGHPLDRQKLRPTVWVNASHPGAVDSQLLTQRGHFRFQPVDSRPQHVAFLDKKLATCEHRDPHDADDVQHGVADVLGPTL